MVVGTDAVTAGRSNCRRISSSRSVDMLAGTEAVTAGLSVIVFLLRGVSIILY